MLDRVFASGQPFTGRDLLIRHDRIQDGMLEDYYYDLVYQPLVNPAGEVEAILAQSIDVTDRLRARHQFEATLSAMSDAVMVVAPDGTLELTNAAFDAILWPVTDVRAGRRIGPATPRSGLATAAGRQWRVLHDALYPARTRGKPALV